MEALGLAHASSMLIVWAPTRRDVAIFALRPRALERRRLKGVKNQFHSGCGSVVLVYEAAEAVVALDIAVRR